jgi:hypothetical protein
VGSKKESDNSTKDTQQGMKKGDGSTLETISIGRNSRGGASFGLMPQLLNPIVQF